MERERGLQEAGAGGVNAVDVPVIDVKGLHKSFGGIVVADDINLSIDSGEIVGLIGPNGAGKTSLFNLISGVIPTDAGSIHLNGHRLDRLPVHRRARIGLARTWQNTRMFHSMSVLDNMLIAPRTYPGESLTRLLFRRRAVDAFRHATSEKAMALLERVGLADKANDMAVELSYGQQKRIGLARALMNDAACLLLDEPMAGVEGLAYETIIRIVREEARAGRAICVVEHNISFIRDISDRAIFMFNGCVLASGSVDELTRNTQLTELYFGA